MESTVEPSKMKKSIPATNTPKLVRIIGRSMVIISINEYNPDSRN